MITIDSLLKFVSPILVAILAFVLNKFFSNRPKLVAYYGYISSHKIRPQKEGETLDIHTHAIVIRNLGKLPAHNVRVSYNILPDYNVIPKVKYDIFDIPDGGKEICFPNVAPKEAITITHLYYPPITYANIKTYIKCDEGLARIINVLPTRVLATWQKAVLYALLFIGATTVLYFAMKLLVCIYLNQGTVFC